jgi:hypothetical protein
MRTSSRIFAVLAIASAFAMPSTLSAQNARQGFWFNGGLGYGSLGCQDCTERANGFSGGLALGGTISSKVLLGVGTNGWTREEDGVRLSAGTLTAQIRFYPWSAGNFYMLGGIGVGSMDLQMDGFTVTETTAGAILGVGYDFRVGSKFSLSPYWNGVGLSNDAGDANFGQIGLGITIH